MSSNFASTEPGGQSDQYEDSIKNVNEPHAKQAGTLGNLSAPNDAGSQLDQEKSERGEQTAAKIRYGQKLSEEGMGGVTDGLDNNNSGQDGYGGVPVQDDNTNAAATRKTQGYGPGSGVGA